MTYYVEKLQEGIQPALCLAEALPVPKYLAFCSSGPFGFCIDLEDHFCPLISLAFTLFYKLFPIWGFLSFFSLLYAVLGSPITEYYFTAFRLLIQFVKLILNPTPILPHTLSLPLISSLCIVDNFRLLLKIPNEFQILVGISFIAFPFRQLTGGDSSVRKVLSTTCTYTRSNFFQIWLMEYVVGALEHKDTGPPLFFCTNKIICSRKEFRRNGQNPFFKYESLLYCIYVIGAVLVVKYFSSTLDFVRLRNLCLMCSNSSLVLWNITLSSWVLRGNTFYHNLVFSTKKTKNGRVSRIEDIYVFSLAFFLWFFEWFLIPPLKSFYTISFHLLWIYWVLVKHKCNEYN